MKTGEIDQIIAYHILRILKRINLNSDINLSLTKKKKKKNNELITLLRVNIFHLSYLTAEICIQFNDGKYNVLKNSCTSTINSEQNLDFTGECNKD